MSCQDKITECPPVACQYPEQEAGKCCPVCKAKNCVINGVIFKEDSTFTNPVDRCQECQCVRGQPNCKSRPCPAIRCRYPGFSADKCCQDCSGEYNSEGFFMIILSCGLNTFSFEYFLT